LRVPKIKKRSWIFTIIYRLDKLSFFISQKKKLALFLDLSWIFEWLSLEYSLRLYDEPSHSRLKTLKPFLEKHINKDATVVDFGCSTGTMSNFYAEFSKEVVGVDFVQKDIVEAKNSYKRENLTFIYGDAYEYLSKNNKTYDVLVFAHVVGYFEKPSEVLKKFKPFFKKYFIEVPDFDFSYSNHYRKQEKRSLVFTDKNYVNEFNRDEILVEVKKAGLKVTDMECRYGQIRIWCDC
jgi:ubiquinone/menaquinone biosynthesis C-methylase UbiE